jgi:hypothetical protein
MYIACECTFMFMASFHEKKEVGNFLRWDVYLLDVMAE